MKKVDMVQSLITMAFEMKPMILKTGLKRALELCEAELLSELHVDYVREGYKWLKAIYDSEYKDVMKIRKLRSEELWDRYEKWGGFEDHREVLMLNEKLVIMRKCLAMNKRPTIFKKTKVEKIINARRNKAKDKDSFAKAARTRKEPASMGKES